MGYGATSRSAPAVPGGFLGMVRGLGVAIALALGLITPATAEEAPTGYDLKMEMMLDIAVLPGLFKVGEMRLQVGLEAARGKARLDLQSTGLAAVTGFRGWAEATAAIRAPMDVQALSFDTTYFEPGPTKREVRLRFDPDTGDVVSLATFKRDEPRESDVPKPLRGQTIDPLSALFLMRGWTEQARAGGPPTTTLKIFDGRRRFDLQVVYLGRQPVEGIAGVTEALELRLRLIPIAGFDEDDMVANWASNERGTGIRALITDDAALVPILIETQGGTLLKAQIRTVEACLNTGGCTTYPF